MSETQLLTARNLVEQSIGVLSLGIKGINALCEDLGAIDQETGTVMSQVLELLGLSTTALSQHLAELQCKSLYFYEGASVPTDCTCGAECYQTTSGNWKCSGCDAVYEGEEDDETE